MSGYVEGPSKCETVQDDLPELALGILSGRRRCEVLDHVGSCPHCSAELEQYSVVADALVQLAPPVEPPVGFELRLAERLRAATPHRPNRRRRAATLCAAAAVTVMLGVGLGALVTSGGGNGQGQPVTATLTTANLTSHGHVLGEVMISGGRPAWMFMTIRGEAWPGTVRCDVTLVGGRVETVGVFQLSGEYGAWAAPLTSAAHPVRFVRLVASDGSVLASGQFGT
jgi:anti-sigma factor RsiW